MVTDRQVRRLRELIRRGKTLALSAAKTEMDEKTARRYMRLGRLPSEVRVNHSWRTREDPFADYWDEVHGMLDVNPGLEAKTLFEWLKRRYPERFSDGQLRTLQRRVKVWRALEGPAREVFFPQVYEPGKLCQSDFTDMRRLGVTIQRARFDHLIYHFVLPYSNWETGTICFSESFESLSEGLQNALWELDGVPEAHRTDRLTLAVQKTDHPEEFTQRYSALLNHYRLRGCKIQRGKPHENGDVEQRHHRLKRALDQSLMLRGSRDFADRGHYGRFLEKLFCQLNAGRQARLSEELRVVGKLPRVRLEACKRLKLRVGRGSTIRVNHNVYSVPSRLIGELVDVRLYSDHLEVWYAQRRVETMARIRGEGRHRINYRHIIEWLVRKPGAFEHYRYRDDLFPTSRFRMAYDDIKERYGPARAAKEYLAILELAATESEVGVDDALRMLMADEMAMSAEAVETVLHSHRQVEPVTEVAVEDVDLGLYDALLVGEVMI